METIMIVEDDPKLAEMLQQHIRKYGFEAIIVTDFEHVLDQFQSIQPHLVVMDIHLPSFDGYYWCRQIRTISTCPIIFISARDGEMDQVMALEYGADDYMTKPFHYELVLAKIRSHLRRAYGAYAAQADERKIEQTGLVLYPERLEALLHDKSVLLTKKEAVLLEVFMTSYPRVVSRDKILDKLWDDHAYVDDNTLSVNMTRLRKKLSDLGIEDAMETIRGVGYRLHITWSK
ncbi:response regulator transcription factor [Paenibacillus sp. 481]|uniref:response regulator transcription factor n=1 Tax=Paenibacillus sp. 481 TaxID=2835869 RepID=UPI001E3023AF|nr:response regulator transcription factor [Paenibacillus sp. 481]UHA76173.1 response regulator transcription factor [Paenibacillus sp. 481]